MATFPALNPSSRAYTPGGYAIKQFDAQSGSQRRVLLGSAQTAATLELSFVHFSEADIASILSHYQEQQGNFSGFALSSNISADLSTLTLTPTGNTWVYAEAPSVEYIAAGVYSATVTLRSVTASSTMQDAKDYGLITEPVSSTGDFGVTL